MPAPEGTCRLDQWKEPVYLMMCVTGDHEARSKRLSELQEEAFKEHADDPAVGTAGIIGSCKELVFDIVDGRSVFHTIMYTLSADRMTIMLGHVFDVSAGNDEGEDDEDFIMETLAVAAAQDVPVYPDTRDLEPLLARYHRAMLIKGFTTTDESGETKRLKLTRCLEGQMDGCRYLTELDPVQSYSPADLSLMREAVSKELGRLDRAHRTLESLELAIDDLSGCLDSSSRNEYRLQACLTRNPILFGADYVRIIPKHRLGGEYEMDYALQRLSGLYDLVEIESSTLPLFTNKGNPSKHLVHAEQQIIDWLDWIEKNNRYACDGLPGLTYPSGYVVIGRSGMLSKADRERLRRRNSIFRGQITILTYDDLLAGAKSLLGRLQGLWQEPCQDC